LRFGESGAQRFASEVFPALAENEPFRSCLIGEAPSQKFDRFSGDTAGFCELPLTVRADYDQAVLICHGCAAKPVQEPLQCRTVMAYRVASELFYQSVVIGPNLKITRIRHSVPLIVVDAREGPV
jgi:hypothetical protein